MLTQQIGTILVKNLFIQIIHKQSKNTGKIDFEFFSAFDSVTNNSVLKFWVTGLKVKALKIQNHLKCSLSQQDGVFYLKIWHICIYMAICWGLGVTFLSEKNRC